MAQSSAFPAPSFSPPEEYVNQDLATTVERTMKKYSDNLMRFLEGISSRISQLELYCYNLDKSVGEMRTELARDNEESDLKLKFIEKHLQEVILLQLNSIIDLYSMCSNSASCIHPLNANVEVIVSLVSVHH